MKLYNRNIMQKRLAEHTKHWVVNDRDAIVWNVDTNNYYALVKIQGSNTTIKAHYPRNWKTIPTWLKRGNSVRIRHRSSDQGFVEIIGHGRAIPTPVEGGLLPTPPALPDGVLSGMLITEHVSGGMNIYVSNGMYRIDGIIYAYFAPITGYIVMDTPAPMTMGVGTVMGFGGIPTAIPIDAAPSSGYGRYDLICIGIDSTVDVVKGSVSLLTSEPSKPSLPADHIVIGYLFIHGGMTSIPQDWIGVVWTTPVPHECVLSSNMLTGDGVLEFIWDTGDSTPVKWVAFTIKDQYDNNYALGVDSTLDLLVGTGGVGVSATGSFGASATKTISYTVTYYYERNQLATPEMIPVIQLTIAGYSSISYVVPIILLDAGGDPI